MNRAKRVFQLLKQGYFLFAHAAFVFMVLLLIGANAVNGIDGVIALAFLWGITLALVVAVWFAWLILWMVLWAFHKPEKAAAT